MDINIDLLISCFYFFVFIFSIIVLLDLLIKFKSPVQLKLFFILIVIASAVVSFCSLIMTGPNQFVVTIMFCKVLAAISFIQIFTNLYFFKLRLIANVFAILSIVFFLFLIVYIYVFKLEATDFSKLDRIAITTDPREFDYNLPIYFRVPVYLFFIGFNAFSLYYSYCILFKFSFKNIYFKRVRTWTISFFLLVIELFLLAILSPFILIPTNFSHFFAIANISFLLLIILYRPSFFNKNGDKIAFGILFNQDDLSTAINGIDFNFHFFNNFYFKNKTANIVEFSTLMGVDKEELTNYIHFTYSINFDELVNKTRVEYFVEIVKDSKFKNYTIEGLAMEVGFSSRQRFYQLFKKYHGGNPSDLIDIFNV